MIRFPEYPYGGSIVAESEREGDPVNQLGIFGDILEGAHTSGVVPFAPQDKFNAENMQAHHIRNRTIATRLWLLGYLPGKPGKDAGGEEIYSADFKAAVRRFQKDAGLAGAGNTSLKEDGWVGDDTWYALDQLVSFETNTQLHRWYKNGSALPALERAIHLRLFSLGLMDTKPGSRFFGVPQKNLDNFRRINYMFKLTGKALPAGTHPETIDALFQQDRIVTKLAAATSTGNRGRKCFTYSRLPHWNKKEPRSLANRFIINVAKIELWLIGFNVAIDGKDDYHMSSRSVYKKNLKLYGALCRFWRQLRGKTGRAAFKLAKSVTPDLFLTLQEVHEKTLRLHDPSSDEDYSLEVSARLDTGEKIENAWAYVRKRTVSLWDGLERLWRWIKQGIAKIISYFKKNLFRAFFRYAAKAYKIVKTAADSVSSTITYLLKGHLKGSTPAQAVILHDADLDHTVFVNRHGDPDKIAALGYRLEIQTAVFQLGTKILGLLLNTFKRVLAGLFGWARFLSALVRNLKELKPLYRRLTLLRKKGEKGDSPGKKGTVQ